MATLSAERLGMAPITEMYEYSLANAIGAEHANARFHAEECGTHWPGRRSVEGVEWSRRKNSQRQHLTISGWRRRKHYDVLDTRKDVLVKIISLHRAILGGRGLHT